MDFSFLDNYRHFGFFGIGPSNTAIIKKVKERLPHARITIRSDRAIERDALSALGDIGPIRLLDGARARCDIDEEILFLSPSVRRDSEELCRAAGRGVRLFSDAELFFLGFLGPVIGVTGSDGKSTTSYLISRMLSLSGTRSLPIGNFGGGFCSLDEGCELPVAELSSFQLMYVRPRLLRAVITNISENHLDWHLSFDEYKKAKLGIVGDAKGLVYDADDATVLDFAARRRAFAACSSVLSHKSLRELCLSDNYITLGDGKILLNGEPYIPLERVRRKEGYNIKNYMLAIGATLGIATKEAQRDCCESFLGLPSRLEKVGLVRGVRFINSSADTTPTRTLATLASLGVRPIVIIGGRGKGLSVEPLTERLFELALGAVLSGEVGRQIAERISGDIRYRDFPFCFANDMESATRMAFEMVGAGGCVLLSPAATSFDLYKSYKDRADAFRLAVEKIVKDES